MNLYQSLKSHIKQLELPTVFETRGLPNKSFVFNILLYVSIIWSWDSVEIIEILSSLKKIRKKLL
jgi:hypothetical protein